MQFDLLIVGFKRYSIHEKGLTKLQTKAVIRSMERLVEFAGTTYVKKLKTDIIREYLMHMREMKDWSPKTFRNHRQNLKSFFDWLIRERCIERNPVDSIEKPRLPKRLPRFLNKDDAETILTKTRWHHWQTQRVKHRNTSLIATFLFTGIRLRELLNLKSEHIDLNGYQILIEQGKGGKDRFVPIHPSLMPILKTYVEQVRPKKWFFSGANSHKQLCSKDIHRICRLISIDAGVKFTPHMLRHTFGRLAIDADLNIYKLKQIMGHADISTTQIYLSVSSEGIKRSFDKIKLI